MTRRNFLKKISVGVGVIAGISALKPVERKPIPMTISSPGIFYGRNKFVPNAKITVTINWFDITGSVQSIDGDTITLLIDEIPEELQSQLGIKL